MEKRILIFTNHFEPENSFKVNDIAYFLASQNYFVKVITSIPNYPHGKFFPGYGIIKKSFENKGNLIVRRLPLFPRGCGSKIRLLLNYCSYTFSSILYTLCVQIFQKKYDLIFVHHTSPLFIMCPAIIYKKIKKSKLILWDLDVWPESIEAVGAISNKKVLTFIESIVKKIYTFCDHILIGSKSLESIIKKRSPRTPISYFPNWADDTITKNKIKIPANKPSFPNGFKIMFAGNIGEAQGLDVLLSVSHILKELPIYWLFVGDGRNKSSLEKKAHKIGLSQNVLFYGNYDIQFMPYFFLNADAMFVCLKNKPIFNLTVPAKVQTYMSAGKPILAMLNGEGAEIIKSSKCGYVVNAGDYENMAEIIKNFSKNPDMIAKCGLNGKKYYEENFSKDIRMAQILKIIEELTNKKS